MTHAPANLDELLERPPARGRRRKRRRGRQVLMFLLLCLFSGIIAGYWYLTDPARVTAMAESYLSERIGGRVMIGHASLSLFEGLRLDNVQVCADGSGSPESVILRAQAFLVRHNPWALLAGRLEATQIVALGPQVRLCENLDTREWNYQRLSGRPRAATQPEHDARPAVLPEMLLRNGEIAYGQIRDGKYEALGSMALDGQIVPLAEPHRYKFELNSRGRGQDIGPHVRGTLDMASRQVMAQLRSFEFDRSIKSMLPAQVQKWWEQHQLAGRIDIPVLQYHPAQNGQPMTFRVETDLDDVTLAVLPEEMGGDGEPAGPGAPAPQPVRLSKVSGKFIFTQDGIAIEPLRGSVENSTFTVTGQIGGYSPAAAANLRVSSDYIYIPEAPHYIQSMPRVVKEVYKRFRPWGSCTLAAEFKRDRAGGPLAARGAVTVLDGSFLYDMFPYPLHIVGGAIRFSVDPKTGIDRVDIENIRGRGWPGDPNEKGEVVINGFVSPLNSENEIVIHVEGKRVHIGPLHSALPREAKDALRMFGPVDWGRRVSAAGNAPQRLAEAEQLAWPRVYGDFSADFHRPRGPNMRGATDVTLRMQEASGAFLPFPLPLEQLTGEVQVHPDHVDLIDVNMKRGEARVNLDGTITYGVGRPVCPDLKLKATGLPLDADFLSAIPPQQRQWLEKVGLGGALDVEGRIYGAVEDAQGDAGGAAGTADARGERSPGDYLASVHYELDLKLNKGTIWPVGKEFAATDLTADMRLTDRLLSIRAISGKRGQAQLSGRGFVAWGEDRPNLNLSIGVKDLLLDKALYRILPANAQGMWDQVHPEGTVDLQVRYDEIGGEPATRPTLAAGGPAAAPTTGPATRAAEGFEMTITPRKLAVTPQVAPYRLSDVNGLAIVRGSTLVLRDITGRHGDAAVRFSGSGDLGEQPRFDLSISGEKLPVDNELRRAVPAAMGALIDSLKLKGMISFDVPKLAYRVVPVAATRPSASAPATRPSGEEIDFEARAVVAGGSMDLGMPATGVNGAVQLTGSVRGGKLQACAGKIDIASMVLAQRRVDNFRADLLKVAGRDAVQLANIQAQMAGGTLGGQFEVAFPDSGPTGYAMSMVLRNADLRELARDMELDSKGQVTASLALQGGWGDNATRRGRGRVQVAGGQLYRVPLVLGLLEIANLSLPLNSPLDEASADYIIDGQRLTFEQLELRSGTMTMQGQGWLDFASRKVRLTLSTESVGWLKVPFLHDLLASARHELLQIRVSGTIQAPLVSTKAMNTFTTTIDEVFNGADSPPAVKPRK